MQSVDAVDVIDVVDAVDAVDVVDASKEIVKSSKVGVFRLCEEERSEEQETGEFAALCTQIKISQQWPMAVATFRRSALVTEGSRQPVHIDLTSKGTQTAQKGR